MKIQEALNLYQALVMGKLKNLKGAKLAYALLRNQSIFKNELSLIENSFNNNEKYVEYEEKRLNLLNKYVERNEKGNPLFEEDKINYKVSETNKKIYLEELETLKKEYENDIKDQKEKVDAFNSMIEKENVPFEYHKINLNDLPDDITTEQMQILMPIIKEE